VTLIRPVVNSWDVFDTLLTRFVPDPSYVFAVLDGKYAGFRAARLGAQVALDKIGKPYVIHDIYAQMVAAGLDSTQARLLLREELTVEQGLMFPIRDAVAKVQPGDLIVSDMYLTGELISGLLADICGLHGRTPVVRSNWGKHSGTIWPLLLRHYIIRTHYGDNAVADGEVPRRFGIETVLRRDIDLTPWEQKLAGLGWQQLALIQREVRLRTCPAAPGAFETLVVGPYLSLLAAFSAALVDEFGEAASFGFLSRDADELAQVFRTLYPAVASCNLDLSRRLARHEPSGPLFDLLIPQDCVLVDGVSTGRSVGALLERIGVGGRVFATLLHLDTLLPPGTNFTGRAFFNASSFPGHHYSLEFLLQSAYPPVTSLGHDPASGGIIRGFGPQELQPAEAALIAAKAEAVTTFCRVIRNRGLAMRGGTDSRVLMQECLAAIHGTALPHDLFPSFIAREKFAPF
jgi:hypothetical protein